MPTKPNPHLPIMIPAKAVSDAYFGHQLPCPRQPGWATIDFDLGGPLGDMSLGELAGLPLLTHPPR